MALLSQKVEEGQTITIQMPASAMVKPMPPRVAATMAFLGRALYIEALHMGALHIGAPYGGPSI